VKLVDDKEYLAALGEKVLIQLLQLLQPTKTVINGPTISSNLQQQKNCK
jgi:hypothetical protein